MPLTVIDEHGSLIPRWPVEWLVCFVPPLKEHLLWWHKYLRSPLKHCFAMRRDGDGWLLFEPWQQRMLVTSLTWQEAAIYLEWGRMGKMITVREYLPGRSNHWRMPLTCAALVAHLLGRPYRVWTPHQLYVRLLRESHNQPS